MAGDNGNWNVYLAGEIHSDWRERIADGVKDAGLPVTLLAPVTDHGASDDVGVDILGGEGVPLLVLLAEAHDHHVGPPPPEHDHALKELDRAAMATAREPEQVVEILRYAIAQG